MTKSLQDERLLITTAAEAIRFSLVVLATGMTLYGVSLSPALAQSAPNELPSISAFADTGTESVEAAPIGTEGQPVKAISEHNTVFFSLGSFSVGDEEKEKLRQHGAYLKANPRRTVTLVGNAEVQGSRSYSLADAEARLAAVSKWLRAYGASLGQIRRNLVDSVKRSATCRSTDCGPQSRRVELEFSP